MSKKLSNKRDRNPDFAKMTAVLALLKEFPDGIWLRKIANDLKLSTSTVSKYVDGPLRDLLDNIGYKNEDDNYVGIRIIKLKTAFLNKEFNSENVKKLLETQKFLKSIGK